jgi:hypothetical protein
MADLEGNIRATVREPSPMICRAAGVAARGR